MQSSQGLRLNFSYDGWIPRLDWNLNI